MASFILEIFLVNGKGEPFAPQTTNIFVLIFASGPTMYLYFRRKFSWNAKTFGIYIGFFGVLGMFAQYVAIPFMSSVMKMHDTTIGITATLLTTNFHVIFSALIAIVGVIIQHLIACFTPITMSYLIYIGGIIGFLSVVITTACR